MNKENSLRQLITILLFLFLNPMLVLAQDLDDYRPIRSQNPIPAEFRELSSEKYLHRREQTESPTDEKEKKKAKQAFLNESTFLVNQVLSSGRVMFNDPVTVYLNQIMDTVLINDPELRKKVRVFAVQSSVVNSFTTDDGIILVNLGLLAQLENEAQMAFILCHELVHYTEKHVMNAYIENQAMTQGTGPYRRSTFDEKLLTGSSYAKQLEKDADRLGLKRFLGTRYSTSTVLDVFEVMRYAHLPFDDIPFDKAFFNQAYYSISSDYFLDRTRPVETISTESGSLGTHPSPTERQQLVRSYLSHSKQTSTAQYLVSESTFKHQREVARFELTDLYIKANRPVMSIYNAFLLMRDHPQNKYLKKNVATALYMLSKFKTGGNFGLVHPGFTQIEGESQQLYHLLYQLKPQELCILATGYVWRTAYADPQDQDLRAMSDDLLKDLVLGYQTPGMFARTLPDEGWNRPDTSSTIENKYERLKQKQKADPRLSMVKYALVDLFAHPDFSKRFDDLEQQRWNSKDEEPTKKELLKQSKEDASKWKNHGFALGAKKVVVVSPTYVKLDLRKKKSHRFIRSESAKNELIEKIERTGQLLGLDLQMLETSLLDSNDVDEFNDIAFLNEWVDNRFSRSDVNMVNLDHDRIEKLISKYGTELFAWNGVINYRENKPLLYFYLLYALIPPAIPFAVYYLARPNFDTYYYCITFNLKTGEPVMVNYNNFRDRDARDMINSNVYDSFWQMRMRPKNQ